MLVIAPRGVPCSLRESVVGYAAPVVLQRDGLVDCEWRSCLGRLPDARQLWFACWQSTQIVVSHGTVNRLRESPHVGVRAKIMSSAVMAKMLRPADAWKILLTSQSHVLFISDKLCKPSCGHCRRSVLLQDSRNASWHGQQSCRAKDVDVCAGPRRQRSLLRRGHTAVHQKQLRWTKILKLSQHLHTSAPPSEHVGVGQDLSE